MKRIAVRTLVIALAFAAGSASAQEYYDQGGYGYGDDYAGQDAGYYEQDSSGYYAAQDIGYGDSAQGGYYGAQPSAYANAGPAYRERGDAYGDQGPAFDVARVVSVDPIVEQAQPVNRQVCETAPAQVYARDDRYQRGYAPRRTSGGGAVLGAIVGGALGNTVGRGDGRQAATVLGAVIGGTIGNDIERNGGRADPRYGYRGQPSGYYARQDVQRCTTVTDYRREERVLGYRVGYEYAGRRYETVTDYHPGSEIRVRVDVTPQG